MERHTEYREFGPGQGFSKYVECFWNLRTETATESYPVLPDGCVDILWSGGAATPEFAVVGSMRVAKAFALAQGSDLFGLRFRPGIASLFLHAPWAELADSELNLVEINRHWRQRAQDFAEVDSSERRAELLRGWLAEPAGMGAVQRAACLLEREPNTRIDEVGRLCGLSTRQLRRKFIEETGLTPKELARILRFRGAREDLSEEPRRNQAELAAESGYYDQAHWISEFRHFTGQTPAAFAAG